MDNNDQSSEDDYIYQYIPIGPQVNAYNNPPQVDHTSGMRQQLRREALNREFLLHQLRDNLASRHQQLNVMCETLEDECYLLETFQSNIPNQNDNWQEYRFCSYIFSSFCVISC